MVLRVFLFFLFFDIDKQESALEVRSNGKITVRGKRVSQDKSIVQGSSA